MEIDPSLSDRHVGSMLSGEEVNLFPGDGFMEGVKPRPTVAAQEADIAVLAIDPHFQGYAKPWFSV